MPRLLSLAAAGKIDMTPLVTERFTLEGAEEAFEREGRLPRLLTIRSNGHRSWTDCLGGSSRMTDARNSLLDRCPLRSRDPKCLLLEPQAVANAP